MVLQKLRGVEDELLILFVEARPQLLHAHGPTSARSWFELPLAREILDQFLAQFFKQGEIIVFL